MCNLPILRILAIIAIATAALSAPITAPETVARAHAPGETLEPRGGRGFPKSRLNLQDTTGKHPIMDLKNPALPLPSHLAHLAEPARKRPAKRQSIPHADDDAIRQSLLEAAEHLDQMQKELRRHYSVSRSKAYSTGVLAVTSSMPDYTTVLEHKFGPQSGATEPQAVPRRRTASQSTVGLSNAAKTSKVPYKFVMESGTQQMNAKKRKL